MEAMNERRVMRTMSLDAQAIVELSFRKVEFQRRVWGRQVEMAWPEFLYLEVFLRLRVIVRYFVLLKKSINSELF